MSITVSGPGDTVGTNGYSVEKIFLKIKDAPLGAGYHYHQVPFYDLWTNGVSISQALLNKRVLGTILSEWCNIYSSNFLYNIFTLQLK